ncbi:MAG: flagellar basal body-associated FliL family protein [Tissierellaceae bacterium]|nr:flagellar basal body-associated FliL family protein [Tissierellaceae bacterium]
MEIKEKRNVDKIVIIALLAAILVLVVGIGYLLISDQQMPSITTIFKSNGEYTIPLDEFIVNLKSDTTANNYLKINIALMYTDEKYGTEINSNINKIRDLVITNLREKTASELLNDDSVSKIKSDIKDDINSSLKVMAIEDIYITDIIVQ